MTREAVEDVAGLQVGVCVGGGSRSEGEAGLQRQVGEASIKVERLGRAQEGGEEGRVRVAHAARDAAELVCLRKEIQQVLVRSVEV